MAPLDRKQTAAARARTGPAERRGEPRLPCSLEAFCRPISGTQALAWLGTVVNLSATGLGLENTRSFERSTFISVELESQTPRAPARLLVRVVHARPMPSGRGWVIGCDFIQSLSKQELQALLSV